MLPPASPARGSGGSRNNEPAVAAASCCGDRDNKTGASSPWARLRLLLPDAGLVGASAAQSTPGTAAAAALLPLVALEDACCVNVRSTTGALAVALSPASMAIRTSALPCVRLLAGAPADDADAAAGAAAAGGRSRAAS